MISSKDIRDTDLHESLKGLKFNETPTDYAAKAYIRNAGHSQGIDVLGNYGKVDTDSETGKQKVTAASVLLDQGKTKLAVLKVDESIRNESYLNKPPFIFDLAKLKTVEELEKALNTPHTVSSPSVSQVALMAPVLQMPQRQAPSVNQTIRLSGLSA